MASVSEYGRASSTPLATKRIMDTSRIQTVEWDYCGRPIAACVKRLKRGKCVEVTYYVDPAFL